MKKQIFILAALIVANVVVFSVRLIPESGEGEVTTRMQPDFTRISDSAMEMIRAEVGTDWKFVILLFSNSRKFGESIPYLEILPHSYEELECLAIISEPRNRIGQEPKTSRDVLWLGPETFSESVGLETASATVVIDTRGEVEFFASYLLRPDFLRQLAEKLLRGEVDYTHYPISRLSQSLRRGEGLGAMEIREVSTRKALFLGSSSLDDSLLLFLTPAAPTCWMSAYQARISELQEIAAKGNLSFKAIFGSQFSAARLDRLRQDGILPDETYTIYKNGPDSAGYRTRFTEEAQKESLIAMVTNDRGEPQRIMKIDLESSAADLFN